MRLSPLNLISTPTPILNSLGLDLRVGLSSEDPMVGRHPSEPYDAYLSIYSPEGLLAERLHLGQIPPNRRRFFNITDITRQTIPNLDHLAVVHRIPSRIASQMSSLEDEIEMASEPDYSMFRSLVEYSYPQGSNGSVIYETPSRLNSADGGQASSNTLTFTSQTVISQRINTYVILIHYSIDRSYSRIATFHYGLHTIGGERAVSDSVTAAPFSIKVLDLAEMVAEDVAVRESDPKDGLAAFNFVGYSDEASFLMLLVNASPTLGAVAVEHTHPPQTYLFPFDRDQQRQTKATARSAWKSILSAGEKWEP